MICPILFQLKKYVPHTDIYIIISIFRLKIMAQNRFLRMQKLACIGFSHFFAIFSIKKWCYLYMYYCIFLPKIELSFLMNEYFFLFVHLENKMTTFSLDFKKKQQKIMPTFFSRRLLHTFYFHFVSRSLSETKVWVKKNYTHGVIFKSTRSFVFSALGKDLVHTVP